MNKKILLSLFLLLSISVYGQNKVLVVSDSNAAKHLLNLGLNYRYQKGDAVAWANPDFNDSNWTATSGYNLNMPARKNAIADRGEIAWFRIRLKLDSTLNDAVVINIYQLGASEIYLDGKLIVKLGTISTDLEKVVFMNPIFQIFPLPLIKEKEQVLAIRYLNAQEKFPIYSATNGFIRIVVSSVINANSNNSNNFIAGNKKYQNNFYLTTGIAIMIFIIFLSLFLFFPIEKINGYFALSNFFLIIFCIGVLFDFANLGATFWLIFTCDTAILISAILSVFCLYKILDVKIDFVFKALVFLGLLAIGLYFFFAPNTIASLYVLLILLVQIVYAQKAWKTNRTAALIFSISGFCSLLFWTFYLLNIFGILPLPKLNQFIPLSFIISPVSLAVYLGYAFAKRSQSLRINLEKVQHLSREKENILSKQNETLELQVEERTHSLNQSLENLKATQSQLVQSEKMASLGELTAGIAHEIQNPLNFVNNFSEVSNELIDEMNVELDKGDIEEAKAIAADVKQNLEKINHHGKRADAIVKGMLQHSRSSSSVKEPTDINALADEYLRLSYHGLRAKDKSFNATMKTDFDISIGKINIIPQDIGRVILNLLTNAFYVVDEKNKSGIESLHTRQAGYEPTVSVSTKKINDKVEIRVADNGNGVPQKVLDKIFQPFFTTKPTGQGTGLGLSLSYDIVTKGHGGELKVETKVDEGSTFIIQLPIL